jgi:hypothetical protein
LDHGYETEEHTRCKARTKKERQCSLNALKGIDLCALHAGLAKAKGKPGYGDPRLLEAYKRGPAPRTPVAPGRAGGPRR